MNKQPGRLLLGEAARSVPHEATGALQRRRWVQAAAGGLLSLGGGLLHHGAAAPTAQSVAIEGTYKPPRRPEVVQALRIEPDGRFSFGISYGAVDATAQGRWSRSGDMLELFTEPPSRPAFELARREPDLIGEYRTRKEAKDTLLVVQVLSLQSGMIWRNVGIAARFSNGKTRSGVTGAGGMLGFLRRPEREWRDARITSVAVLTRPDEPPSAEFKVNPEDRAIVIDFDPEVIRKPPFMRATLRVQVQDGRAALEVEDGDLAPPGTLFRP